MTKPCRRRHPSHNQSAAHTNLATLTQIFCIFVQRIHLLKTQRRGVAFAAVVSVSVGHQLPTSDLQFGTYSATATPIH
jgi:hypothetical protein